MNLVQNKTEKEVFVPLNDTAIKILGEQGDPKKKCLNYQQQMALIKL